LENNSWEDASSVSALDQVAEFYLKYPGTPRHIHHMDFEVIFKPPTIALNYSNLRRELILGD